MARTPKKTIEPIDASFDEVAKAVVSRAKSNRTTDISETNQNIAQTEMSSFLLYKSTDCSAMIDVFIEGETVWLTQKHMAELFGVEINTINYHIKEIFKINELDKDSVIREIRITAVDSKKYVTKFYNLDVIISVGYRVNSLQATQFRIWATRTLREFIVKGFVLDDDRLKANNNLFGKDYFQELIEKIREIRASERRFYQKITDIYALSADYNQSSQITRDFFATVQNKLHWAITGKTAAEMIYASVDASREYMGLKTWKNAPHGKILKSDVSVAKNYLDRNHIKELERIVSAYLDLAENRAERGIVTKMQDWAEFLDKFLELSSYPILHDKGKVRAENARIKAEIEYSKFRTHQDKYFKSDFDNEIKKISKI
uniref:Uncharacterized conserved protein n=1 Tax=Candidatus Kentrum sp. UNK TaxID=2126344 RepID=A0A451B143_9GAMM|nr:MAG: Uncharacterized conserved protein [Candidatus Kentron sp. UNK]VFK71996.1 MAG: Uncharacterized conserved protein [Candidatus Kentron sp. UNK]